MRNWRKAIVALAVVAVLAGFQLQHLLGSGGHQAAAVPRFTLTDHHGRTITEAEYRGQYLLIYFGYTFCPDVCPTSLSTITEALEILGTRADTIVPILISVDPQRDSTEILTDYVAAFSPRMVGLTGTPEQIEAAAQQFGAIYARNGDGTDYTMDHSASIYLIAPDGRLVTTIPHGTPPRGLADMVALKLGG